MFNPSREQVRQFFCDAWRKHRERLPLVGAEVHRPPTSPPATPNTTPCSPTPSAALDKEWTPEGGQMNPFLHLSLHLAIHEQVSIDQPPGIRAAFTALQAKMEPPRRRACPPRMPGRDDLARPARSGGRRWTPRLRRIASGAPPANRERTTMKFEGTDSYVATHDLTLAVNAAIALQRPLLIKGEPGTGKTVLAEEVAARARHAAASSGTSSRPPRRSRASTNTTPSRACATRSSATRASRTSPTTSCRHAVGGLRVRAAGRSC